MMAAKLRAPENPGVPLRDPRDRSMLGPLSSDAPPFPPELKPLKPRPAPLPDTTNRTKPASVPPADPQPPREP
jgi:hypothetical protein